MNEQNYRGDLLVSVLRCAIVRQGIVKIFYIVKFDANKKYHDIKNKNNSLRLKDCLFDLIQCLLTRSSIMSSGYNLCMNRHSAVVPVGNNDKNS